MRIHAKKQGHPQQGVALHTSRLTKHTIANQAEQASTHVKAEGRKVEAGTPVLARFAHDFSRIPLHSKVPVSLQTKLTVNTPGDSYEQEADRIAEQVMATPAALAVSSAPPHIQRFSGQSNGLTVVVPASVDHTLASQGSPLESRLRQDMEQRFGHDFSRVRVHSGAAAGQSARDVNANAYTVGHNIVFAPARFAPETQAGRRLIAHELAHVIQQTPILSPSSSSSGTPGSGTTANPLTTGISHLPSRTLQRDADTESGDPWDKLTPSGRRRADQLFDEVGRVITGLGAAQLVHKSVRRNSWLKTANGILTRIRGLDSDSKFQYVNNSWNDFGNAIARSVEESLDEWEALEKRYLGERRYLLSKAIQSTDTIEAARYLDKLYEEKKDWLDRGVMEYITDEDYLELKVALDKGKHIWGGTLRGARIRAKQLQNVMDEVEKLRRSGEDANKYIPGWESRVQEEAAHLDSTAKRAKEESVKDSLLSSTAVELSSLRDDLLKQMQSTLAAHAPETSTAADIAGAVVDVVSGGVEAIVGPIIEAAKEAVDLAQIVMHYASLGKYEPEFKSDMAEAAKQGKSTTDLLKGMVTGIVETPGRFLQACKDGDWRAIGRESVNLYMLAKTVKESPEMLKKLPDALKKLPEMLAKTSQALKILRARKVSLEMQYEGRLSPPPPKISTPPTPSPTPAVLNNPPPSRPVTGFVGKNQPPPAPAVPSPAPSRPVAGFGRNPEPSPAPAAPSPSRPVAGFGRDLKPPPAPGKAPQGPPVVTDMPPAKVTPSSPDRQGVSGQRRDQPAQATAGKKGPGDDGPQPQPSSVGKAQPVKPLLTADDLNAFVPKRKGLTGEKRRLTTDERIGAKKVLPILERVRNGELAAQAAWDELANTLQLRNKMLTGDLNGWREIDLLPGNPGGVNQMRLIVRIHAGGGMDVKLLQMH